MTTPNPEIDPHLCKDFKSRQKFYDLLVRGGYFSVMGESEERRADGDRTIEYAKEMIIEKNRECVASNCHNIRSCTGAIEKESPLRLPEGFFSPDVKSRKRFGVLNFSFGIIKRVFQKSESKVAAP